MIRMGIIKVSNIYIYIYILFPLRVLPSGRGINYILAILEQYNGVKNKINNMILRKAKDPFSRADGNP